MKIKVVLKLRQEVKVKVDIGTSDDIKIYYSGKFQDFTARYIIKRSLKLVIAKLKVKYFSSIEQKGEVKEELVSFTLRLFRRTTLFQLTIHLTFYQTTKYKTSPNSKHLQTTK